MQRHFLAKLVMCFLMCPAPFALAQTSVGQITGLPAFYTSDIAVNPITNRIYVTSTSPARITVLDGNTNTVADSVFTGDGWAESVAVDPLSNRVYVATQFEPQPGDYYVVVLDGATDQIVDRIYLGSYVQAYGTGFSMGGTTRTIAVDPLTRRIYVAGYWQGPNGNTPAVAVIDGRTDRYVGVVRLNGSTASSALGLAVNYYTHKIYAVGDASDGPLFTIRERGYRVSKPLFLAHSAKQVAVDVMNNRVFVLAAPYLSVGQSGSIYVVDGRTNQITGVIPNFNESIAVDPLSNRLWAVDDSTIPVTPTVSLINATTNAVLSTANLEDYYDNPTSGPIAVNPVTNTAYVLGGWSAVDVLSGN